MKNLIFRISSIIVIALFLIMAVGSGDDNAEAKIEVEDISAIQDFIIGNWSHEYGDIHYRYTITNNKIVCWTKTANWDWKAEPDDTWAYSISEVKRKNNGDKYRDILIDGAAGKFSYCNSMFIDNCFEHFGQCMVQGWD